MINYPNITNFFLLLYLQKRDEHPPSISISRGARGDYKITGEVLVGVEYKEGQLQVRLNRAIKLAAVGKSGTSNPYIKLYLLPDSSKKSKLKTSIKKKTLDPVFNETLQVILHDTPNKASVIESYKAISTDDHNPYFHIHIFKSIFSLVLSIRSVKRM